MQVTLMVTRSIYNNNREFSNAEIWRKNAGNKPHVPNGADLWIAESQWVLSSSVPT